MTYDLPKLSDKVQAVLAKYPRMRLDRVAQQFRVDRHTLEKAIRIATGKSFRQLQQEALLHKSMSLLLSEPALSVKDIAFRVGYGSPQAFQRFIKRVSGRTPIQIRAAASTVGLKKKRQNCS